MNFVNDKIKQKASELLLGSSHGRDGEHAGLEMAKFIAEKSCEIDNPVLAISYLQLVEAVEKLRAPENCYGKPFFTNDYRAEMPWHTSNQICKTIVKICEHFANEHIIRDKEILTVFLAEIDGIFARREPILKHGGNTSDLDSARKRIGELFK